VSWATQYIQQLREGRTVSFRPRGNSMRGKMESGQLRTVEPVATEALQVGGIVLCKVNGRQYLHLVKAIDGNRFLIGNNRGRTNGWIGPAGIYGRCIRVE
jgi:hypothetical protein